MTKTNTGNANSLSQPGSSANTSSASPSTPHKLKTRIPGTHWRSAVKFFDIAERFNVVGLREIAKHHLMGAIEKHVGKDTYVTLLEEVWSLEGGGADELHDCVCRAICSNMSLLLEEPEFQPMIERTSQIACCVFGDMQKEIERLRQPRRR